MRTFRTRAYLSKAGHIRFDEVVVGPSLKRVRHGNSSRAITSDRRQPETGEAGWASPWRP